MDSLSKEYNLSKHKIDIIDSMNDKEELYIDISEVPDTYPPNYELIVYKILITFIILAIIFLFILYLISEVNSNK